MGPSIHESYTDAFSLNETAVCGCHQETWLCTCCWSVSLSLGIDLASLPVHYLLTRAVASGEEGEAAPRNCWAELIKSVNGFVIFRLSYFDCSNLHLFSIFMGEDTDPPLYKARAFGSHDNAPPPPPLWQKTQLRPCLLCLYRKPATSQFLDD